MVADNLSVNSNTPLTEVNSHNDVHDVHDAHDVHDVLTSHSKPPIASLKHNLTAASLRRKSASTQFGVSTGDLAVLHDPKSLGALADLGGFDQLLKLLNTTVPYGLNDEDSADHEARVRHFGANRLPIKVAMGFFRLCFEAMKDKVLILLSVAAIVSLALGLYETFGEGTMYDDEGKPMPKVDWVEGVAILVAVFIVVVVGAGNDYQKERQFARLNAKKEDKELIVVRNGEQKMISVYDLVVGDILNLQTGDIVSADCILFQGEVESDESSVTGESDSIRKIPVRDAMEAYNSLQQGKDLIQDPFLISGSKILSGLGNAVVTAVGENSMHGRTMMSLSAEAEITPLTKRLNDLAEGISKYGFLAALLLFIILLIRYGVNLSLGGKFHGLPSAEKGKKFVDILITSITIVVVAIPEGLPLAVTLALAFATTRMAKNGNLVRVLRSCETMGGATVICSDKTGTLTENRMRITRAYFGISSESGELLEAPNTTDKLDLNPTSREFIVTNIVSNSTAFKNIDYNETKLEQLKQRPRNQNFIMKMLGRNSPKAKASEEEIQAISEPYLGNKTESALLILAEKQLDVFVSLSLEKQRAANAGLIVQVIPFESERKWSGMVMKVGPTTYRFYAKGAAEILFKNCGYQYGKNGELLQMNRSMRDHNLNKMDEYTMNALRAIALVHFDFEDVELWPPTELLSETSGGEADPGLLINSTIAEDEFSLEGKKLILDMMVGILDPLKSGVTDAVGNCKLAGVQVKMLTGDNLITAKAISQSCNILTGEDLTNEYAFMEGPAFRKLSIEEKRKIVPKLKVLARSSPEDKRMLVQLLREAGEVVAVTGDGTNDAPALKLADVGFSMGISGTEVAREASDIILMTDDFTDIVQAIKWGRTVATSIKKFIQFQLTVNVTAVVLTFVSAVASSNNQSVLTAVQLLWVNLIMDTLAALALATDKPDDLLLRRKPAGRKLPLITTSMWKMILGQSSLQLVVTFVLHFAGSKIFYGTRDTTNHENKMLDAMTFNTFVWLQFWKLFVTRKLDEADGIKTVRGRITADNLNFFQHLFRNWYFITIALIIGGCQVLIMFVGGAAFSIARQTGAMWGTALICGFLSVPMGWLIRITPDHWVAWIWPTRAFNVFIYYVGFDWLSKKNREERKQQKLGINNEDDDEKEEV